MRKDTETVESIRGSRGHDALDDDIYVSEAAQRRDGTLREDGNEGVEGEK